MGIENLSLIPLTPEAARIETLLDMLGSFDDFDNADLEEMLKDFERRNENEV